MENEKFLALQGVAIKSSHSYTKIALKMLGRKLSFDVFAIARSIFTQLYESLKIELGCEEQGRS